jgi:dTDP-glucose 4,6-dehydratase
MLRKVEKVLLNSPIVVTGGAGFIGSNFVLQWLAHQQTPVTVFDKLTYAGNLENLTFAEQDQRYRFVRGDIVDGGLVRKLLDEQRPKAVVHFAAESHVDRSILGPGEFIRTNIEGTFQLLEAVRGYWSELSAEQQRAFRFLHVSTDEVYGSLTPTAPAFTEETPYAPNSPYSASKAASDHLVRAYHHTYGLPVLTTNCSNNYGPRQFPEKLIPLVVLNALKGVPLPVYGDGQNVRDWRWHPHRARRRSSGANVQYRWAAGDVESGGGWADLRHPGRLETCPEAVWELNHFRKRPSRP